MSFEPQRFIPILALQKDNEFIPFWLLTFDKEEESYFGDGWKIDADKSCHVYRSALREYIWDTIDKKVILGKVIDYYEKPKDYEIGKRLYQEMSFNAFREAEIIDIFYEEYESTVYKIKEMDKGYIKLYFTPEEIKELKLEDIYEVRTWKPFYKMDNGDIVKWSHELKEKYIEPTT